MKELSRKTFLTIFSILSLFLFFSLCIINTQNYRREYQSISRNLNIINERNEFKKNIPLEFDKMRIMDYEMYTVILNSNNEVENIISHSTEENIDIESISKSIIKNSDNDNIKIGNLYLSKYAYNYKVGSNIIIINTTSISKKLRTVLIETIIIFILSEIIIYMITRVITKWIIKPAEDAFIKQKDFIADASHELKTPLAVIMASSDELRKDKKNEKYIENIKYESDRMKSLISNMLDLSKVESGITKSTYKEENISKIAYKASLTLEAIAYEKGVKINTNIIDDIRLKCSKEEIEKVFSILIDNAIKHSYENTSIKVEVLKNKNITIKVINKGDPINKGDEEKIFERFYRVDKSRNRGENRYGLGLAIAKSIVENHNGNIKAYSKDKETTFEIDFKI